MSSGFIEKNQNNIHNGSMEDRHKQKLSYPLRMPDELRLKLENEAKKVGRSLHAEIVARLEQSFSEKNQFDAAAVSAIIEQTIKSTLENIEPKNFSYKKSILKIKQEDLKKD